MLSYACLCATGLKEVQLPKDKTEEGYISPSLVRVGTISVAVKVGSWGRKTWKLQCLKPI